MKKIVNLFVCVPESTDNKENRIPCVLGMLLNNEEPDFVQLFSSASPKLVCFENAGNHSKSRMQDSIEMVQVASCLRKRYITAPAISFCS